MTVTTSAEAGVMIAKSAKTAKNLRAIAALAI
jgi:hypothetical protein